MKQPSFKRGNDSIIVARMQRSEIRGKKSKTLMTPVKGEDNVLSIVKTKIDNNDEASDEEKSDVQTAQNKPGDKKSDDKEKKLDVRATNL